MGVISSITNMSMLAVIKSICGRKTGLLLKLKLSPKLGLGPGLVYFIVI